MFVPGSLLICCVLVRINCCAVFVDEGCDREMSMLRDEIQSVVVFQSHVKIVALAVGYCGAKSEALRI